MIKKKEKEYIIIMLIHGKVIDMKVTENYLNITLGVNFNELWFWKSRIR